MYFFKQYIFITVLIFIPKVAAIYLNITYAFVTEWKYQFSVLNKFLCIRKRQKKTSCILSVQWNIVCNKSNFGIKFLWIPCDNEPLQFENGFYELYREKYYKYDFFFLKESEKL